MKKSFVVVLALMFVLGIAGTAFAAANPFVDVPAKHWAYEAVSKLAKAGIVDGYGDGTFRGDKTMTRYEMAQIVAKAMAKSDKADAQNKATIDKLAVEFAAELNNLGVRVAKLEKNASNIKVEGESRLRFTGDSDKNGQTYFNNQGTKAFDWRQRLHLNAQISPNIKYTARLEATGVNGETSGNVTFNRNFFTVSNQFGLDQIVVGKFGLYAGKIMAIGKTSNNDGLQIKTKAGALDLQGFWTTQGAQTDLKGLYLGQTKADWDWSVGYVEADRIAATAASATAVGVGAAEASKAFDLGVWFKLAKGWNFVGEYTNTKINPAVANEPDGKAWGAQVSYNWTSDYALKRFFSTDDVVNKAKAHEQGVVLSYRSIDKNGLPGRGAYGQFGNIGSQTPTLNTTYDRLDKDNVNVWYFGYQNVMQKNVLLNIEYAKFTGKTNSIYSDKQYTAYVQFYF